MRIVRSGWSQFSRNVSGNLAVWMIVALAVTVAATALNYFAAGRGSNWGHVAAVAGMFLGILVMMKAQEGHVAPEMPDEDDAP